MGGVNSNDNNAENAATGPVDLEVVLKRNTYKPTPGSVYPYFLVQLGEKGELLDDGVKVSDAIADYVSKNHVTHIIAQTHGWNTPPDKAVAVPFTEFMSGMQNDHTMPPKSDDFSPIWIAFIWPALPFEFFKKNNDALTRAELVAQQEREIEGEDSEIVKAIDKAKAKAEADDDNLDDDKDFLGSLRQLVQKSRDDDDDDDDDDNVISQARTLADEEDEEDLPEADRGLAAGVKAIMRPVEHLVFGRLQARGQRTGKIMGEVLGKVMKASSTKVKVCMMANSLGAHVLCGVLNNPQVLPYKIHTAFFVQSAISKDNFDSGGKFSGIGKNVAGPLICTYSERDLMLKNVFGPFHGKAVGFHGTNNGSHMKMKPLTSLSDDPYVLTRGEWSNVDGTEFIDEGNPVAGGHGDFKEDETTCLYWSAITATIDEASYEH